MADTKISALSSLTKATVASGDILPIVQTSISTTKNITYGELMVPQSNIFRIADNTDITKLVAFNLSGLTTATTRTLTIPDASDTVVLLTQVQTLTNKTLTSPVINVTSDATGDIYYRSAGGLFTRLAIGSNLQILQSNGTIPSWVANPSAAPGSYTVQGVLQGLTDAITSGLTITAGVISVNFGVGANQIVKLNGSSQLPAISGALLTNLPSTTSVKNGTTTKDASDASTTQNIAHGLGVTPKYVKIIGMINSPAPTAAAGAPLIAQTVYNGTTQSSLSIYVNSNTPTTAVVTTFTLNLATASTAHQDGVVTFDGTNIIITWTKTGSPTGVYTLLWEAFA